MRKLSIALIAAFFVIATMLTVGCDTGGGEDCTTTEIAWTCENDVCTCDEDGNTCTHPDDTDADDQNNCDNLCEFCAD